MQWQKKKKRKQNKNTPSLIEVEKDYGFFEDFMEYGHNMTPSMIALSYPVRQKLYSVFHLRNWLPRPESYYVQSWRIWY